MVRKIENIDQFNRFFNQPTYHPLVSVVNLADAHLSLFEPTDFGMYCVVLMDADFGQLTLRGATMTYQAGTVFTMKPGHVVSMQLDAQVHPKGWMLAFRPELIINTGFVEMLLPAVVFDADPIAAVAALEACVILTANEAKSAVVANTLAIRAVFSAALAYLGAIRASAAFGAYVNANVTKTASFAHFARTFRADLLAVLADRCIVAAAVAALAMDAVLDRAVNAKLVIGAYFGTVKAYTALLAIIAVDLSVAFVTFGTVHSRGNSAFNAKPHALFGRAIQAYRNAVGTGQAFLAPVIYFKIAASAGRAVTLALCGTFYAKKTVTEVYRAGIAHFGAGFAFAAFLAPRMRREIAFVAV